MFLCFQLNHDILSIGIKKKPTQQFILNYTHLVQARWTQQLSAGARRIGPQPPKVLVMVYGAGTQTPRSCAQQSNQEDQTSAQHLQPTLTNNTHHLTTLKTIKRSQVHKNWNTKPPDPVHSNTPLTQIGHPHNACHNTIAIQQQQPTTTLKISRRRQVHSN